MRGLEGKTLLNHNTIQCTEKCTRSVYKADNSLNFSSLKVIQMLICAKDSIAFYCIPLWSIVLRCIVLHCPVVHCIVLPAVVGSRERTANDPVQPPPPLTVTSDIWYFFHFIIFTSILTLVTWHCPSMQGWVYNLEPQDTHHVGTTIGLIWSFPWCELLSIVRGSSIGVWGEEDLINSSFCHNSGTSVKVLAPISGNPNILGNPFSLFCNT